MPQFIAPRGLETRAGSTSIGAPLMGLIRSHSPAARKSWQTGNFAHRVTGPRGGRKRCLRLRLAFAVDILTHKAHVIRRMFPAA